MASKLLTPNTIWEGFEPELPDNSVFREVSESVRDDYTVTEGDFSALETDDGSVYLRTVIYQNRDSVDTVIIIVPDYHKKMDFFLPKSLAALGYDVYIPDICGRQGTKYPASLSYGYIDKAGLRLSQVSPTAKETCQFLYSILIRRTVTFAKARHPDKKIVLLGLGEGVEVAFQAAGTDKRIAGLACINGSCYKEYLGFQKFGASPEPSLDEGFLAWLSGVAAAAYARLLECPTLILISTNGAKSDPDRMENAANLFKNGLLRFDFTPRAADYVGNDSFKTLQIWLNSLGGGTLPLTPTVSATVSEEGMLYVSVTADTSALIDGVDIYYSSGEYCHTIREWHVEEGLLASAREYIANPVSIPTEGPFFAFAKVRYCNGLTLSSAELYMDLTGKHIRAKGDKNRRIIYSPSSGAATFTVAYDGDVMPGEAITQVVTKSGARGIKANYGYLKSYHLGSKTWLSEDKLLMIDILSREDTDIDVILYEYKGFVLTSYVFNLYAHKNVDFFVSHRFVLSDFKNEKLQSPASWSNIKALTIAGKDVAIGNILFI